MSAPVDTTTSPAAPSPAADPLVVHFDARAWEICGWAAPRDAARRDDMVILSLMIGSVLLGSIRRDGVRPDVDAHLGFSGPPTGFCTLNYGLEAFARMSALGDLAVVAGGGPAPWVRHPLPLRPIDSLQPQPLASRARLAAPLRLADLWYASNRDLCLRFDGDGVLAWTVDIYQGAAEGDRVAVRLAADRPVGAAMTVVTARLVNPLLPLLLVFRSGGGMIEAIDFIPFPSLARGGRHAAERLMLGQGADELAEMATLSHELLDGFIARDAGGAMTVRAIELDPAVHTGLEPMLDDDLLEWLAGPMAIAVRVADAEAATPLVREKLERAQPQHPGHALLLPADAIPTISALLRPIHAGAGGATIGGAMGVVDWGRHGAAWSIWTPPVGDWLDGLQWRDGRRAAPLLRLHDSGGRPDAVPVASWPLALVLRDKPVKMVRDTPFEVAAELPLPLLRSGALPDASGLTVVILFDRLVATPVPLLESLVRQHFAGTMRLIVCRPAGEDDAPLREALATLYPDRHTILSLPRSSGRLEQIAQARGLIGDEQVLLVTAQALLPDARTVATLLPMLAAGPVATAACLVRGAPAVIAQAGYGPVGIDLRATPGLSFETIDPAAFRQPATYPVVAGAMTVLATRRALLASAPSRGSDPDRPDVDDLLLGLHAIAGGGLNLCTTIVSAYADRLPPRSRHLGLTIPYRLTSETVARLIDATSVIQKIQ